MARRATRRWTARRGARAKPWWRDRRPTSAFLKTLCEAEGFRAGQFDTGFIDRNLEALGVEPQPVDEVAVAAGASALISRARSSGCAWRRSRTSDEPSVALVDATTASSCSATRSVAAVPVDGRTARPRSVAARLGRSTAPSACAIPGPTDAGDRRSSRPTGPCIVCTTGRQTLVQPSRSLRGRSRAHGRGRRRQGADARQARSPSSCSRATGSRRASASPSSRR